MKKEFTRNETVALMHENEANAFRMIADHIERFKIDHEESVRLLREIADEKEAQAMVVSLRDNLMNDNLL